MKVLVDTNFLLRAVELGKDLFVMVDDVLGAPTSKVTVSNVIEELERLIKVRGSKARRAELALKLAEKIEVLPHIQESSTDEAIIRASCDGNFIVATDDIDLRRRLRSLSVPVIFVKKGYLSVEGYIKF